MFPPWPATSCRRATSAPVKYQVAEIHDLHFGPPQGTFFTKVNPLMLVSRFGEPKPKTKKP